MQPYAVKSAHLQHRGTYEPSQPSQETTRDRRHQAEPLLRNCSAPTRYARRPTTAKTTTSFLENAGSRLTPGGPLLQAFVVFGLSFLVASPIFTLSDCAHLSIPSCLYCSAPWLHVAVPSPGCTGATAPRYLWCAYILPSTRHANHASGPKAASSPIPSPVAGAWAPACRIRTRYK